MAGRGSRGVTATSGGALEVVNSVSLYILSANRTSGTTTDFTVAIQDGFIECRADEFLRFTLTNLQINQSYYTVSSDSNNFTIIDVATQASYQIVLNPGTYTIEQLAYAINALFPSIQVGYNSAGNLFTFSSSTAYQFVFTSNIATLMGFNVTDTPTGTSFTSTRPILPRLINELVVHLRGVTPALGRYPMSNFQSNTLQPTNILGVPAIASFPFDVVTYHDSGVRGFSLTVQEKKISSIQLRLSDSTNRDLTYVAVPDWTCVLLVEWLRPAPQPLGAEIGRQLLEDIRELLRLGVLQKHLSDNPQDDAAS
jgi:hypothetical protein